MARVLTGQGSTSPAKPFVILHPPIPVSGTALPPCPSRGRSVILVGMKADRVEIVRDEKANRWVIKIQVGEEVIRRPCHEPHGADHEILRDVAVKTAADEGYTVDPSSIILP